MREKKKQQLFPKGLSSMKCLSKEAAIAFELVPSQRKWSCLRCGSEREGPPWPIDLLHLHHLVLVSKAKLPPVVKTSFAKGMETEKVWPKVGPSSAQM